MSKVIQEEGVCPCCGDTLDYGSSYPQDGMYAYEWNCENDKCNATGVEWYEMNFIEHVVKNVPDNSHRFWSDVYGDIIVRQAMFDVDGTNLEEGIEIKLDDTGELIELYGSYDISELSVDELNKVIENKLG